MRKGASIIETLTVMSVMMTIAGIVAASGLVEKNTADHEYAMEKAALAASYLDKVVNECKDYDGDLYHQDENEVIFGKSVFLKLTCRRTGNNLYKAIVKVCDGENGEGCDYEKELYFYKKWDG